MQQYLKLYVQKILNMFKSTLKVCCPPYTYVWLCGGVISYNTVFNICYFKINII